MQKIIDDSFENHIKTIKESKKILRKEIKKVAKLFIETINSSNKIILCGNGGSASDAQHIAAELTGRFQTERIGLNAIAITTDTSAITAIANDYGFEYIFSRQLEAIGKKGDLLVAISTSGNSKSIINSVQKAKEIGINSIALSGKDGGELAKICKKSIIIPSNNTARIQETHILIGHIICNIIDEEFTQK
jgi:D-sedoheptulose 7-phosphate isomerase